MYYNFSYAGTPPNMQQFNLRADWTSVIIRIMYPQAGSFIVQDANGNTVQGNAWDTKLSAPGTIRGDYGGYCGENRYLGVVNILEFYLNANCQIMVVPVDSIQTSIRLNWTLAEFYSSGGTTKFVDRMAAALGIKAANVKIVSVYEGSVVTVTQIQSTPDAPLDSVGGTSAVQSNLVTQLTNNAIPLGAPIMSVSITSIVATPTAVPTAGSPVQPVSPAINIPLPYAPTPTPTVTPTTSTTTTGSTSSAASTSTTVTPAATLPPAVSKPINTPVVVNTPIITTIPGSP